MSRKEFETVVEAYRLSLKTNPHDFYALRGLMLAAAFLKDMDGLVHADEAKSFSYNPIIVNEVIDCASEEDKEYFKKYAKLYADKKRQIDCNREIVSLCRDRERIETAMRLTEDTRRDYYIKAGKGRWHPKAYFIFGWCATAFFNLRIDHRRSFGLKRHWRRGSLYGCFWRPHASYRHRC